MTMCVSLPTLSMNRGAFVRVFASSLSPLALGASSQSPAVREGDTTALPSMPAGMLLANVRAARISAASPFVRRNYAAVEKLANDIGDPDLRTSVSSLLKDPHPAYASRHPGDRLQTELRDRLAREGFVKSDDPIMGIFPGRSDGRASQPFWSAPGSSTGSHHAYPGGLATHELFNASVAIGFAATYDRIYFTDTKTIDHDTVVAAALYHDIMKTVVFQWQDDGTLAKELTIAGTGAHHTLSGAEAIVRGRSPRFVITLLSAHAAPSLGEEAKVVQWCRAAAMIAGVDPVAFGLVVRDGYAHRLSSDFVPTEAFINHLSDHDYVLSVHAMIVVREQLARLRVRYRARDLWFENAILAQSSAIALYQTLATNGRDAFDREIDRIVTLAG